MKSLLLILSISISTLCFSQTNHQIVASGMTWSPDSLSIVHGDTVTWINSTGTHNVNGTSATFPGNSESFGNAIGTNWTYQHVFTFGGQYDYQCDVHVGSGMTGWIEVSFTGMETTLSSIVDYYPNPTSKEITIELDRVYDNISVKLTNINGKLISINKYGSVSKLELEIKEPSGIYFIEVLSSNEQISKQKVIKK